MKTVEAEVCDALLLPYLTRTKRIACLALAVATGQEEQGLTRIYIQAFVRPNLNHRFKMKDTYQMLGIEPQL